MSRFSPFDRAKSRVTVVLAGVMLGLFGWMAGLTADETPSRRAVTTSLPDLRLDPRGGFSGQVVNPQGQPQAKTPLVLYRHNSQSGWELATKLTTDPQGRFRTTGLRPGMHQLVVGSDQQTMIRVWDAKMAPPGARPELLVVTGDGLSRGQRPFGAITPGEKAFIVGGMVAAAIAIPIAVANSDDDDEAPVSP